MFKTAFSSLFSLQIHVPVSAIEGGKYQEACTCYCFTKAERGGGCLSKTWNKHGSQVEIKSDPDWALFYKALKEILVNLFNIKSHLGIFVTTGCSSRRQYVTAVRLDIFRSMWHK